MEARWQQIPKSVKTTLHEVVLGVKDANQRKGDSMLFALYDDGTSMDIVGANTLSDVVFYAAYFNVFGGEVPGDVVLLRATIEDPENLPYEVSDTDFVYVIFDDWSLQQCDSIEDAVDWIETSFRVYADAEIENFAVLVGRELGGKFKEKFAEKVEERKKEINEGRNVSNSGRRGQASL